MAQNRTSNQKQEAPPPLPPSPARLVLGPAPEECTSSTMYRAPGVERPATDRGPEAVFAAGREAGTADSGAAM
ncbi:hypothetical protein V499_09167 [Pseudogymnoascus sp. VKM F-103]|nr:hypothetical protein V499_09167 [Pseudogymnoascus sp. VKM F-103]